MILYTHQEDAQKIRQGIVASRRGSTQSAFLDFVREVRTMKNSGFYYEFYNPSKTVCGVNCLAGAVERLPRLGLHNAFFVCDDIDKSTAVDEVRKAVNAVKIKTGAMYEI